MIVKKLLVVASLLLTQLVYAGQKDVKPVVQTGKIYFEGTIVEPACQMIDKDNIICYKNGKIFKNNEVIEKERYNKEEIKIDSTRSVIVMSYY